MPYIITCTTNKKNNSTYKNIRSLMDNNVTYGVAKFLSYRDALAEMENILENEYDAEYDLDKSFFVNEECVYKIGDKSFFVEGKYYEVIDVDCIDVGYEYCNECEDESEIVNYFAPQRCQNCGKFNLPCSICENQNCSCCPLKYALNYAIENEIEIVFDNDGLRVDGVYLTPIESFINEGNMNILVGRTVFWLDPCFKDNREHTSYWYKVVSVNGDILTLENCTECLITECYI